MEEDKIKISGEDNKIEIEDGEKIEIKGDDNIIKIKDSEQVEIEGDDNVVEIGEKKDIKESFKDVKESFKDVKSGFKSALNFFQQKKVLNILIISLLILILIGSTWIRLQNLPLLVDSTTGEYIPLALDPFYFLRVAETMIEGDLPDYDVMKHSSLPMGFTQEILPRAVVFLYKIISPLSENITLRFVDVISPVIFFTLGLLVFFFLIFVLTKSKWIAILSSLFLAIIPSYLYRTLAGFSDHESIGMFAFFAAMLIFSLALIYLDKEKNRNNLKKIVFWGVLTGIATAFTFAAWGGIVKFLFMIIPASFFIFWLVRCKNTSEKNLLNLIWLYLIWIVSTVLFGMLFGYGLSALFGTLLGTAGLLSLFVPVFMIVDYFLIQNDGKIKSFNKKYRQAYSFGIAIVLGILFLIIRGESVFQMIGGVWNALLHPFGRGRVGLTVAENAQPYLVDWINQTGKVFFWMFITGLVFIGIEIGKKIKLKKERNLFVLFWIIMFSGILFSRISEAHLLNGLSFISQAFYILGLLVFVYYTARLYFNNKIKISPGLIIISVWMFFMVISVRSAIRFFFALTPFVCFSASFFVIKSFEYLKKNKDELLKILLIIILILGLIGAVYSLNGFYKASKDQAKYTGPSANVQWQNAMSWVRENTPKKSVFAHWWDYGYWVQSLGKRPTIADGGHFQGGYRDHMIGRYILTTPKPETALSFMKSNDVSYLLIDPTDLGKYAAYSKIGSDEEWDRFAYMNTFISEESQIQETSSGTIRVYQGGIGVDEDIIYGVNDSKIFIPGPIYNEVGSPSYKSFVGGVILESLESEGNLILKQPEAVFMYNNEQIKIPLKYAYFNGKVQDFGEGLDAVFFVFPKLYGEGQGVLVNNLGAGLYLSPKVSKSLFAQLYLMNDVFNNYETIKLAHSEDDSVVKSLKMQGIDLGEFVYYQEVRGPIKIWDVKKVPENILVKEEFLRRAGEYAEFDDLKFID